MPSLDRYCDGFRDGELIVISGPTKNGKTLLAQSLTASFVKQQEFPLWFSFEVPARQFLNQFPELPLFYLPQKLKAHVLTWVEERIRESFEKYRTRIVFLDHLHYLFDMARTKSPSIEIGTVIRHLKTMAVEMGMCIFLLCHTTKGKCEDLSYSDIRDSSFVSQESDCVLMVQRQPDKGEMAAKISIEFHRRTGVLEKMIEVHKENGFLVETQDEEGVKSQTRR
jgi:replicative DNA helicase